MALAKERLYTSEDYWALPEGERAELIDGQLYYMAPPYRIHQKISLKLSNLIDRYIENHQVGCEVYTAPFAVNLTGDDGTWVEPDISVICDKNKLSDRGCEGAPDWIIEIISPSTQSLDYGIKLFKYRSAGVQEYWIVNPAKNSVMVYTFGASETALPYRFDEDIPVGIYPDFSINISEILK